MTIVDLLWIILGAPFLAAGFIALFLRRWGACAAGLSVSVSLICAGLTGYLFAIWDGESVCFAWEWFALGDWTVSFGFLLDRITLLMLMVVSIVGLCVQLYSLGYMAADKAKPRYFAGLSFFVFSMTGIVLVDNLIALFVFWELVGFSSYLLINHYFGQPVAPIAAKKAFLVNRVGDFGLLIGIVACYHYFGTVDLKALAAAAVVQPGPTFLGLLLLCGVLAKSAQLPLHIWLPDAMAGPTPVSALMHAATMVAAGVFLLCRTVFLYTDSALTVITWIGAATAFYAALCALGQKDIKRVLAYSTLSQLGFMVTGFALGTKAGLLVGGSAVFWGVAAALFHLTTHAFFKALLFLGAGSVIHACKHEQDIFRLGGLRSRLPFTFAAFTVGVAAIVGIPFVAAGFFSKEIILFLAWENHLPIFLILFSSSLLTVIYMLRLWFRVFWGPAQTLAAEEAHEVGWGMRLALAILAGLSILAGWTALYPPVLDGIWQALPHADGVTFWFLMVLSSIIVLVGLVAAWSIYFRKLMDEDPLQHDCPQVFSALLNGLYLDTAGHFVLTKIQRAAQAVAFGDRFLIGGLLFRGSAGLIGLVGFATRRVHTGSIQTYIYWFLAGLLLYWASGKAH